MSSTKRNKFKCGEIFIQSTQHNSGIIKNDFVEVKDGSRDGGRVTKNQALQTRSLLLLVGTAKINRPWRRDGPSLAIKFLTLQKRLGHYKWKF